jgi:hypothetical protein
MHRYTAAIDALAIGVAILILAAIITDPVIARPPVNVATEASWVSSFDLMLEANDLPVEAFSAI